MWSPAEDEHVLGLLGADGIDVLIDRVGRPHVPVLADPLHGRQDFDELADLTAENIPAFADLAIERKRLVLRQDKDAAQAGVDAVGKRDVDDAVDAAEGHGRFGAVAGERIEAFACASGEQDSERIFHHWHTVIGTRIDAAQRGRCPTQRAILAQATRSGRLSLSQKTARLALHHWSPLSSQPRQKDLTDS